LAGELRIDGVVVVVVCKFYVLQLENVVEVLSLLFGSSLRALVCILFILRSFSDYPGDRTRILVDLAVLFIGTKSVAIIVSALELVVASWHSLCFIIVSIPLDWLASMITPE